jgi:Trk K+ transport system NAD-binding subunit
MVLNNIKDLPKSCDECKYLKNYERLKDHVVCTHLLFGCYFHKETIPENIKSFCRLSEKDVSY